MKVDFAICGTQKGGTTALDSYLREHPEICMANRKELHFFDTEKNFNVGSPDYSEYHSWFSPAHGEKVFGEATPIYMYWEKAPARMHAYNPAMKLIFLLRNPIERAFSHWNMEQARGNETRSFEDAIAQERLRLQKASPLQHRVFSYVDRGFYTRQLERIDPWFSPNQVLLLKMEELYASPQSALHQVTDFLAVSPLPAVTPKTVHATPYTSAMTEQERGILKDLFRQEILDLEARLGWDCSDWLQS